MATAAKKGASRPITKMEAAAAGPPGRRRGGRPGPREGRGRTLRARTQFRAVLHASTVTPPCRPTHATRKAGTRRHCPLLRHPGLQPHQRASGDRQHDPVDQCHLPCAVAMRIGRARGFGRLHRRRTHGHVGRAGGPPDHALRACRAALAMLRVLPALNERWQTTLKESIRIGIGLNTGPAASATSARTSSSNTARSATPSTWPAACRGPQVFEKRACWPRRRRRLSSDRVCPHDA